MKVLLLLFINFKKTVMYKVIAIAVVFLFFSKAKAQVSVDVAGSTAHPSAALDIKSATKGLLIPRLTAANRNAIVSPAKGLLVYDSASSSFWFYNGSQWKEKLNDNNSIWNEQGNLLTNRKGTAAGINIGNATNTLHINSTAPVTSFTNTFTGTTVTDGAFTGLRQTFLPGKFFIWNNENSSINMGTSGNSSQLVIDSAGNVGVGLANPTGPLSFQSNTGEKINFLNVSATEAYGIGIKNTAPFPLQFYTPTGAGKIQFGYGETGANFTETMSVDLNSGNVNLSGKVTRQQLTGNGSSVLPVAFAKINADGSIGNNTGSMLVTRLFTGLYEVTLFGTDIATNPHKYAVLVTPLNFGGFDTPFYNTTISNGKIILTFEKYNITTEVVCSIPCDPVTKITGLGYTRMDGSFCIWVYKAD
jgi:hypothetical protein